MLIDSDFGQAHSNLGTVLAKLDPPSGDLTHFLRAAEEHFVQAIMAAPSRPEPYLALAEVAIRSALTLSCCGDAFLQDALDEGLRRTRHTHSLTL